MEQANSNQIILWANMYLEKRNFKKRLMQNGTKRIKMNTIRKISVPYVEAHFLKLTQNNT
jgi:hypothetical protein